MLQFLVLKPVSYTHLDVYKRQDTPGFDDEGELGNRRIERTWKDVYKRQHWKIHILIKIRPAVSNGTK